MLLNKLKSKLESWVEFVWSYNPNKLTPKGISSLLIDLFTLIVSYMFIVYFPKEQAQEPMLQWIGAAGLLMVMIYAFLPAMSRIFFGSYEHYVEE